MITETISNFLNTKYKEYSYYVIQSRAIPSIIDGLKPVQRRALWTARSTNDFKKVSALAGECLKLHPHGDTSVSQAISNMTQNFCGSNNIPLFEGKGSFGSKILGPGKGVGAPRYVSVRLSKFSKEMMFADEDLINIIPNYDGEYTECEHLLPIIPVCLLNGITGIAVGFATEILPFKLSDLVQIQLDILSNAKLDNYSLTPFYAGFKGIIEWDKAEGRYYSLGSFTQDKNNINITELPIGTYREQFIKILDNLLEKGTIKDYEDNSKGDYNFTVIMPRGTDWSDAEIITKFKLKGYLNQNLTLLDTNNNLKVYNNVVEIIEEFTNWRFTFIKKRYEKMYADLSVKLTEQEELLKFIKFVIKENYIKKMTTTSRAKIKEELIGKFPSIDKLLGSPVSIFTEDHIKKLECQIEESIDTCKKYDIIIKDDKKQRKIYADELMTMKRVSI